MGTSNASRVSDLKLIESPDGVQDNLRQAIKARNKQCVGLPFILSLTPCQPCRGWPGQLLAGFSPACIASLLWWVFE